MKGQSCLNCKHVSYVIVNLQDEKNSIFYCTYNQEIYMNTGVCAAYQEKSRDRE